MDPTFPKNPWVPFHTFQKIHGFHGTHANYAWPRYVALSDRRIIFQSKLLIRQSSTMHLKAFLFFICTGLIGGANFNKNEVEITH